MPANATNDGLFPEHYSPLFLAVRRVFGKKTPETRRDEKIS